MPNPELAVIDQMNDLIARGQKLRREYEELVCQFLDLKRELLELKREKNEPKQRSSR